jgi:thiamine-phosphate pyrophosphorylase
MAKLDPRALDLYVITTGTLVSGRAHGEIAAAAIEGGATAVQLRAPELDDARLLPLAEALAAMCGDAGVLFIVNDRVDVAARGAAAGAHVGQADDPAGARARLGPERILGVSVGDVGDVHAAEAAGADYLGVTVFETSTKRDATPIGLEGLRAVTDATELPIVGVGGIDASNARTVLEAGAAGIAVISAVAAAPDPAEAVLELRSIVEAFYEETS